MISIDIYKKIFPTLDKNLQARVDTCRALGMKHNCIGCILVTTKERCFLERSNKDYRLFLEQHPEFLV